MGVFKDRVPNGPQRHMLEDMQREGFAPMLTSQPSRYHVCEVCSEQINPMRQGSSGRWEGDDCVYRHAPVCPEATEEG